MQRSHILIGYYPIIPISCLSMKNIIVIFNILMVAIFNGDSSPLFDL